MPTQIMPDERGILGTILDPDSLHGLLGGVSDIVSEAATVWEQIEAIQGSKPLALPPSPPPTTTPIYQPNITLGDFKFMPNTNWLIVGGVVLVVALIIRRL